MEKTRVKKGEKYWCIVMLRNDFIVLEDIERDTWREIERLESNNYFHTQEQAESVARKLQAILKGADVIEMPSEEEIKECADERAGKSICPDFQYSESKVIGNRYASFIEGVEWLKSKIVK